MVLYQLGCYFYLIKMNLKKIHTEIDLKVYLLSSVVYDAVICLLFLTIVGIDQALYILIYLQLIKGKTRYSKNNSQLDFIARRNLG